MEHNSKPLRVLLSAYACEPGKGSEPGVGWNVVRELSSRVHLTVVTRPNNRSSIEDSGEDWVHHVNWIYWDPPKWLTFWKRGGRGIQLFYLLWQAGIASAVRERVDLEEIDILHHLTFGKYWVPSSLASLPLPFIFGPVGGGEVAPPGLEAGNGWRGQAADFAKSIARSIAHRMPSSRRLYHAAAWSFAATSQTEKALRSLGVTRVSVLPQSGIRPEDLPDIAPNPTETSSPPSPLKLVTAARLIHWKAIDLAIEAIAVLPESLEVHLTVLQEGPEHARLMTLARRLGVAHRITFAGHLPTLADVYREIAGSHALVHPALHEAFGQACLESMALGVPVICLNWGGPALIVDQETGFTVEPGDRTETISRLAQAIMALAVERQSGRTRKEACTSRAFKVFHWKNLTDAIVEKYTEIS